MRGHVEVSPPLLFSLLFYVHDHNRSQRKRRKRSERRRRGIIGEGIRRGNRERGVGRGVKGVRRGVRE